MTVSVLWLFLAVPCVGLQCVIVVFRIIFTYFLIKTKYIIIIISSIKRDVALAKSADPNEMLRCAVFCLGIWCLLKYAFSFLRSLTLKVRITNAADDKFCDIFPNFRQK